MSLSSVTVIAIVCSILGACLFVTSAVLVYKLRPGRRTHHGKMSDASSDIKIPPVRKLAIMHGRVISLPSTQRKLPRMPRWPRSLYSSRQPSAAASPTDVYFDGNARASRRLLADRDLEAQAPPFIKEKEQPYRVTERHIPPRNPRRLERQRKSSIQKPKAPLILPESLPISSWHSYNGHRPVGDELTSSVSRLTPPLEESSNEQAADVMISQEFTKVDPSTISIFNQSIPEDPSIQPQVVLPGSPDKQEPKSSSKALGKATVDLKVTKPIVGRSVLKAASISAVPTSAFEPKPTPPSSDTGDSSTGRATLSDAGGSRTGAARESEIRKPSPLNLRETTPFMLDFEFPSPPQSATTQLKAIISTIPHQTTSTSLPESSKESQTRPRSRSRSRSRSCSRSRSTSRSGSRSRSRPRRARKRPPPIAVNLAPASALPMVVRTPASPPSNNLDTLLYNPITLIYTPEPVSPINEESDATLTVPTPLRIPTPPISTDRVPPTISPPTKFRGAANRQSTQTVDSSTYSPTFSLAPVRRVPLYAGRARPQVSKSGIDEEGITPSTGKRRRASSKTLELASIPMMPSGIVHTSQTSRVSIVWPTTAGVLVETPSQSQEQGNESTPIPEDPMKEPPRRRTSVQALDYDQILNPSQPRGDRPPAESEGRTKSQIRVKPTVQPRSRLHSSVRSPGAQPSASRQSATSIKSSLAITGRRKSRCSHLFDKALPALPSEPGTPPQSAERPSDSKSTTPKKSDTKKQTPYPRESLLWRQESVKVSPIKATQSSDQRLGTKMDEGPGLVSPMSEDFPTGLRRSNTEGSKKASSGLGSPPLKSAIYW